MPDYEVFISRKHLDEAGAKTADVAIAQDLHDYLVRQGVSTFLDDVALLQQGRALYKRAIDDALDQAKVLVAVGTSREHLESEWVRYEWDGYFNDIISGIKPEGQVISLIKGMKPAELPRALRQSQAFDVEQAGIERASEFIFSVLGRVPPVPAADPVPATSPSPRTGKLPTAIMFIDMVGSTRLYKELGDNAADRIIGKAIRDWDKITRYYGGWVIKSIGDEIMCAFETAEACVNAAIEIRAEIAVGLRGESIAVSIKTGLAYGEAFRRDDGDIFGYAVNIAARMAGCAEADKIMIDGRSVAELSPGLQSRCSAAGETSVKGLDEPISVFEVT